MKTIHASVGRGGVNRSDDVQVVQELLNQALRSSLPQLTSDGQIGSKTIEAIEAFQKEVVKLKRPDGLISPEGRTFAALATGNGPVLASGPYSLPSPSPTSLLREHDFQRAANVLGCEVACIKAVTEVESGGNGFFASGRPKILFEAHIFSQHTGRRYDQSNPDISSKTWNRALYKGGEREYERLQKAIGLSAHAALQSASWGRFQIMGSHYQRCGFPSVEAFVEAMFESEARHMDAFVSFLQSSKLDVPLRAKRWTVFARGYNGAGYATNKYDIIEVDNQSVQVAAARLREAQAATRVARAPLFPAIDASASAVRRSQATAPGGASVSQQLQRGARARLGARPVGEDPARRRGERRRRRRRAPPTSRARRCRCRRCSRRTTCSCACRTPRSRSSRTRSPRTSARSR